MICGIPKEKILNRIDNKEIFKIVCRIKKIDYETIIGGLINRIKDSDIVDKNDQIGHTEIWDDEYIHIVKELDELFIYDTLLFTEEEAIEFFKNNIDSIDELGELWIETTDEEKEVIKIAKECNVSIISIEMM